MLQQSRPVSAFNYHKSARTFVNIPDLINLYRVLWLNLKRTWKIIESRVNGKCTLIDQT
jgi:hypothetical protein